jgi:PadR family transcriptional regulator
MTRALPVVRGTLDLLVLRALARGPMHGFEVVTWLDARAHGNLELLDSAMYQALYRLEERRLVTATWGMTDNRRRARYYQVTPAGRAHLRQETAAWQRYTETVSGILADPQPA